MSSGLLYEIPKWLEDQAYEIVGGDISIEDYLASRIVQRPRELEDTEEFCFELARQRENLVYEAEAIALKIKELQDKKARRVQAAEALRAKIQEQMLEFGMKKIKNDEFTIFITERQGTIQVDDENSLPSMFKRVIMEPDKAKIKEHYRATGEIIDGCIVGANTKSVTIKTS